MQDLDLADPELAIIINIEGNKKCIDCQKDNPRWCSINNAVFLCASCTRKHRKFNLQISYIKSLEGDLWTKDEIKKLYIGGNERFNKLMSSYNIPLTLENSKYKYHTKIAEYYRNLLNEEIKGKKIIDIPKPSLKEGIEIINKDDYDKLNLYAPSQDNIIQNNDNNNNFNNNQINMNNDFSNILNIPKKEVNYVNPFATPSNKNININQNNNNYNNNFNNNYNNNNNNSDDFNIEQHLNNLADSMTNVFSNISHKASSIDYNEKLRNAEEFIKDKKEKIENSDTFKGFMNVLSSGFNSFMDAADNFLNNNLNDISQQRRNNNIHDNRNQNQMQFQGQRINNLNSNNNEGYISSNMNYSGNNNANVNMNFGFNNDDNNDNQNNNNNNHKNNENNNIGNLNNENNNINNMNNDINNNNNIDINFYNNTPLAGKNLPNINDNNLPRIENINSEVESQNNENIESLDDDNEKNENDK